MELGGPGLGAGTPGPLSLKLRAFLKGRGTVQRTLLSSPGVPEEASGGGEGQWAEHLEGLRSLGPCLGGLSPLAAGSSPALPGLRPRWELEGVRAPLLPRTGALAAFPRAFLFLVHLCPDRS